MPLRRSHVRACARRGVQPAQQARTHPLDGFPVNWLDVAFEGHNLAMAESPAFRTGYMSLLLPSSAGDLEVRSSIRSMVIEALAATDEWPIRVDVATSTGSDDGQTNRWFVEYDRALRPGHRPARRAGLAVASGARILLGSRADYNKVGVRGGAPPCYRRQHPRLETIGNSPSSSGFNLGIPPGEDGSRRLRPTRQPWSSRTVGAVDRTRGRVSTSWWADGRAFIGGTASGIPLVSPG